jgi:hypothetical protein
MLGGLLVAGMGAHAQGGLPLNSSGKIEVLEVVRMDSLVKEELFQRAITFFNDESDPNFKLTSMEKDSVNGKMKGDFQIIVYVQTGVLKKIQGAVSYSLALEVKDGKYRYDFTGFVYHYYAQNRNYQTVDTGKRKMLEDAKATGWQKAWDHCRSTTASKVKAQIISIKAAMATKRPSSAVAAVESKKTDW